MRRVAFYVDGFNLYHAIAAMNRPELKWLDLWDLATKFVDRNSEVVASVNYFSAYATWLPGPSTRHRAYVAALQARGVMAVMGKFKKKPEQCRSCNKQWDRHEEKESDVNIAIHLLHHGYQNSFDRAVLITRDSDLAPAVALARATFAEKKFRVLSPPGRMHSKELVFAAGGPKNARSIQPVHLERSLLPERVEDDDGHLVATRPAEYAPRATCG